MKENCSLHVEKSIEVNVAIELSSVTSIKLLENFQSSKLSPGLYEISVIIQTLHEMFNHNVKFSLEVHDIEVKSELTTFI